MPRSMSLFSLLPVIIAFLLPAGCTKSGTTAVADSTHITVPTGAAKTWLALGDSYTIGQSVDNSLRYPAQATALLKAGGVNMTDPEYIATTGWTTNDLINAINLKNPKGPYDIVTLLIGVNDQYQHLDTGAYRKNFTQLLQTSIQLAGNNISHVFVLSIPDYGVTPFGASDSANIRKQIDQFNNINKQITLALRVSYTDITPASRLAKNDASLIAGDGLHPSGTQYAAWANLLFPALLQVLK